MKGKYVETDYDPATGTVIVEEIPFYQASIDAAVEQADRATEGLEADFIKADETEDRKLMNKSINTLYNAITNMKKTLELEAKFDSGAS